MVYALVHYPDINKEEINLLRRKYDPQFNLIEPHITIIFPVSDSINEAVLVTHIVDVLHDCKAFPVHLNGLKRSWDNYLFLLLQEGNEEVIGLHEAMYTGILAPHHQSKIAFTPHVTLGRFEGETGRYIEALKEAEDLNLNHECLFDRVHLVKVDDERTCVVWSKEFLL